MTVRLIATLLLLVPWLAATANSEPAALEKLRIKTETGDYAIYVEIVRSLKKQQTGLMYRKEMAADHGMLFLYDRDQVMHFWMKNTFLPLDLIFIAKDGRLAGFFENAVPHSLANMSSAKPVRAVLEINVGLVKALAMKIGDQVIAPTLGWPPSKNNNK